MWDKTHCGRTGREYWHLVQDPGYAGSPGSYQQCEYCYSAFSLSLSSCAFCDLTPWIRSTGILDCLYIRIPAKTVVPIWVWLELSGICQLHPGLCPTRDYAPAMPVPWSARWEGQPHSLLLAITGCEACLCHCVWGECNVKLCTGAH